MVAPHAEWALEIGRPGSQNSCLTSKPTRTGPSRARPLQGVARLSRYQLRNRRPHAPDRDPRPRPRYLAPLTARWLTASAGGKLALATIIGVPLAGSLWVGTLVAREIEVKAAFTSPVPALETLPEGYPRTDRPAPDFDLVDQTGATVTLESLHGRPVLLTFAYAHCQTICPVIVRTVSYAAERLGDLSPAVVVVTLDPWRDTPSSLASLAESWDLGELGQAHVLSGEVPEVQAVLEAYEVPSDRDLKTGEITHPALVYLLDPEGTIAYTFNNPSAEWLIDASRRVSRERVVGI